MSEVINGARVDQGSSTFIEKLANPKGGLGKMGRIVAGLAMAATSFAGCGQADAETNASGSSIGLEEVTETPVPTAVFEKHTPTPEEAEAVSAVSKAPAMDPDSAATATAEAEAESKNGGEQEAVSSGVEIGDEARSDLIMPGDLDWSAWMGVIEKYGPDTASECRFGKEGKSAAEISSLLMAAIPLETDEKLASIGWFCGTMSDTPNGFRVMTASKQHQESTGYYERFRQLYNEIDLTPRVLLDGETHDPVLDQITELIGDRRHLLFPDAMSFTDLVHNGVDHEYYLMLQEEVQDTSFMQTAKLVKFKLDHIKMIEDPSILLDNKVYLVGEVTYADESTKEVEFSYEYTLFGKDNDDDYLEYLYLFDADAFDPPELFGAPSTS